MLEFLSLIFIIYVIVYEYNAGPYCTLNSFWTKYVILYKVLLAEVNKRRGIFQKPSPVESNNMKEKIWESIY